MIPKPAFLSGFKPRFRSQTRPATARNHRASDLIAELEAEWQLAVRLSVIAISGLIGLILGIASVIWL